MIDNDWTILSDEAFTTEEKAQRFIDIVTKQGTSFDGLEFKISERKNRFYILYRIEEKHAL